MTAHIFQLGLLPRQLQNLQGYHSVRAFNSCLTRKSLFCYAILEGASPKTQLYFAFFCDIVHLTNFMTIICLLTSPAMHLLGTRWQRAHFLFLCLFGTNAGRSNSPACFTLHSTQPLRQAISDEFAMRDGTESIFQTWSKLQLIILLANNASVIPFASTCLRVPF